MRDLQGSLEEFEAMLHRSSGLLKTPSDLARYEIILERLRPAVVVETGFAFGESARWFAQRVPQVISVEMNAAYVEVQRPTLPENVHPVVGRSQQAYWDVERLVWRLADRGPVLVVLDSEHDTLTVLEEMILYRELVTPGSYLVVEDGMFEFREDGPMANGEFNRGSPHAAVSYYLANHDDFEVDQEIEDRFPTTLNPQGWLRRR